MNQPGESPVGSQPAVDSAERRAIVELRKTVASMEMMYQLLALCALMMAGTMAIYFLRQVSMTRRQLDEAVAYVEDYNRKFLPQIQIVEKNLESFAKTNDTLTPVLRRYFPGTAAKVSGAGTNSAAR